MTHDINYLGPSLELISQYLNPSLEPVSCCLLRLRIQHVRANSQKIIMTSHRSTDDEDQFNKLLAIVSEKEQSDNESSDDEKKEIKIAKPKRKRPAPRRRPARKPKSTVAVVHVPEPEPKRPKSSKPIWQEVSKLHVQVKELEPPIFSFLMINFRISSFLPGSPLSVNIHSAKAPSIPFNRPKPSPT